MIDKHILYIKWLLTHFFYLFPCLYTSSLYIIIYIFLIQAHANILSVPPTSPSTDHHSTASITQHFPSLLHCKYRLSTCDVHPLMPTDPNTWSGSRYSTGIILWKLLNVRLKYYCTLPQSTPSHLKHNDLLFPPSHSASEERIWKTILLSKNEIISVLFISRIVRYSAFLTCSQHIIFFPSVKLACHSSIPV